MKNARIFFSNFEESARLEAGRIGEETAEGEAKDHVVAKTCRVFSGRIS